MSRITNHVIRLLVLGLFLFPVVFVRAQDGGFTETFDDSALPGWEHTPGVFAEGGVLHIELANFAFYPGEWGEMALKARLRRIGDGELVPNIPLEASDLTWVRLGGPLGGLGYDIRMRPDNPDIMYVTDAWAGVHKSVDGGRTWFSINKGIDARSGPSGDAVPVFCLTIDPNNYDIIWAGTQSFRGVYRSEDGGETWEKRVTGIMEGDQLTIRGIAIEPGNSDVVYAAGEISTDNWGREFNLVKGVVYKSTNAGLSW